MPTPSGFIARRALELVTSLFEYITAPPKPGDTSSRPPYDHLAQESTPNPLFVDIHLPNMSIRTTVSGRPKNRRKREAIPLQLWDPNAVSYDTDRAVRIRVEPSDIDSQISDDTRDSSDTFSTNVSDIAQN